ncbi:thermonuclease family protein [Denitrobaculum tricleocarpae]|uniref:Thermonuclease family protein n=1 Tax=Denitrobaculum tricleocarpae TaxID=2591009 RepID=A0A545TT01_9PROT|nr:thermonuclease family protein [Denitrobaculum tricleocarpae]TQV80347.1 thermonuclease family protein [Denitrobaculum tricleocarpae]
MLRPIVIALFLTALTAFGSVADTITGIPRSGDGDTFKIAGTKIRIHGIDAPESTQQCKRADGTCYACGTESTEHMQELIAGLRVTCALTGKRSYDRMIGVCSAGGNDLAVLMLQSGWAVASRRYLGEVPGKRVPYLAAEQEAERDKAGMWQGEFTMPWDWRRGRRSTGCGS